MSTKPPIPSATRLKEAGALLRRNEFLHSYPHSWRSKAPLIFRATPQWFIRMDGEDKIREKALAAIDETKFVPEIGRNRIGSMVESPPGLVHHAASAPGACRSPSSSTRPRMSRCAMPR